MAETHPLLELQRIDSAGDALRRERDALPARAALAGNRETLARLATEREATRERLIPLGREERRVEGQVAALREQAREVETTLYSGTVRVVSELEGLQAQLTSLKQHQAALEEEEMGLLEQQETLEDGIIALDRQAAELEQQNVVLAATLEAEEARIDALLAGVGREREAHLPTVPAAALSAYERLRASMRFGGVVAAPLEKDFCGACRTSLPVTHVTRLRAAGSDEVLACLNCQRLLVAPGSGGHGASPSA